MQWLNQSRLIQNRLLSLFRQPIFWFLTVVGNGFILGGAALFHHVESGPNPEILSFLDSLQWAVATVTTIGSTGVVAGTTPGKVISIVMMLGGSIFLWSYMALFVGALISPELTAVESGLINLEQELEGDEEALARLEKSLGELQSTLAELQLARSLKQRP